MSIQGKFKYIDDSSSDISDDGEISSESQSEYEPEIDEEAALQEKSPTSEILIVKNGKENEEPKINSVHNNPDPNSPGKNHHGNLHEHGHSHSHDDKRKRVQIPKTGWRKYGGVIFGLGSCFFLSLAAALVKVMGSSYHPFSMSLWRHCAIFIPSIPIVIFFVTGCNQKCNGGKSVNIFQNVFPLKETGNTANFLGLMARGIIGCTSILLKFYALKYLSIPDASVIAFSGTVVVFILAHFCLGEKCGVIPIFVAALTLIGVTIVFRPPLLTGESSFNDDTLMGGALGLSSMLLHCMLIIVARKLRRVHFSLMLITFGLWGVLESAAVCWYFDVLQLPSGLRDTLIVFGLFPFVVFGGQMCIILALKYESAGPVSLIRTCDIMFAFLWQFLFLSKIPEVYSLVAAFFIVLGVIIITFRKWLGGLPESDSRRKTWRILLL